jgi:chromosome segregation ATPase
MKECISKVDKIFGESLEMLRFSQLKEEELKQKVMEKDKQIEFWVSTNEDVEFKLTEMDAKKIELENELREIKTNNIRTEKKLKKREDEVMAREKELRQRENEIDLLRLDMRQSNMDLRLMEDQKSMAMEIKDLTKEELKNREEEYLSNQIILKNTIKDLKEKNKKLEMDLDELTHQNENLGNELYLLKKKLEKMDWGKW